MIAKRNAHAQNKVILPFSVLPQLFCNSTDVLLFNRNVCVSVSRFQHPNKLKLFVFLIVLFILIWQPCNSYGPNPIQQFNFAVKNIVERRNQSKMENTRMRKIK